jgi:hypothetical protein
VRAYHLLALPLLLALPACSPKDDATPAPLRAVNVPHLDKAFQDGSVHHVGGYEITVKTLDVGTLLLPSGEVIANDPFALPHAQPFSLKLAPGQYPVILSLAYYPNSPDPVIAAAKLRITERAPVAWYLATISGQDPSTLAEDEIFGYPVDSGTSAFLSPESAAILGRQLASGALGINVDYIKRLNEEMSAHPATGSWVDVRLEGSSGLNAVLFTSGYGDGFFASYWGLDETGQVACLVTDFAILEPDL